MRNEPWCCWCSSGQGTAGHSGVQPLLLELELKALLKAWTVGLPPPLLPPQELLLPPLEEDQEEEEL